MHSKIYLSGSENIIANQSVCSNLVILSVTASLHQDVSRLQRLVLTGEPRQTNPTIRQLCADLFGAPAYVAEDTSEAGATGGALPRGTLSGMRWYDGVDSVETGELLCVTTLYRVANC